MSVLPETKLLLLYEDKKVAVFSSYTSLAGFLGVTINDDGVITCWKGVCNPVYRLKPRPDGWTKEEAIRDWSRCYLSKHLEQWGYEVYRFLS
jgi:hypothetical protein